MPELLGKDEHWRMTEESNGHRWGFYRDMKWESCRVCGWIRRADDKNTPCKGPVKVSLRTAKAQP